MSKQWSIEEAIQTYCIEKWAEGYFTVNEKGNMAVLPVEGDHTVNIDIDEVIKEIKSEGIQFPAVIRFHDILRSQIKKLNRTFRNVIEESKYEGRYFGVYPVKVNQMREVVEEIVDAGSNYDYGLEAGSKPEILSALAYNTNTNSLTILNGYKDKDFFRLGLLGSKLGRKVIFVIEKFSELRALLEVAKEMKIKPMIGIRAKISVRGIGKWADSGGDNAKFGLTIPEIIELVKELKDKEKLSIIKLIHFHIGSQVIDIKTISEAVSESARIYAKLRKMGVPIDYFDIGGGLAIDYDGSKSVSDSSKNYNLNEYVEDVVYGLKQVCDLEGVPHPNIVSESGRSITAHHSCVITNVIDSIEKKTKHFNTNKVTGEHILVSNIRALYNDLSADNFQVTYNEALQIKTDCMSAFRLGVIELEERAKIETIYWELLESIKEITNKISKVPSGLQNLNEELSSQYICNFSVFQSTADSWAINQLLPIVPISYLNERPTKNCSLVDITCDSDGKIDKFISMDGKSKTVPLHDIEGKEEYYIGIFLTGAYQDVMGDMHNLFGRLNEVHVFCDDDDPTDFYIEEVIQGNSSEQVLSTMQYNPDYMAMVMKKNIDRQIQRGKIQPREGVRLVDFYEECLKSYTYLK
ncbi:MAG: biosynthetic arginine decarboxylase [Halobacteriovoraceae bacterium]|nr:biosynthetic arginine decarboxylase [Halobacteriovoraceae bacterium]